MPTIQDTMVRSIRGGMREILARQTTSDTTSAETSATTTASDVSNTVTDVKTAFSSWDNCMQASFCKWPVIAIIIVGGLIIFSIVWCIVRCACCGLSCCCSCCRCLKCCGDCCGCCDEPRKEKRGKYLEEPYIPPNQGYQAHAPMTMGGGASSQFGGAQKSAPPQYAEFDVSRKGGDDALPEMPSWEGAAKTKVMLEDEGVELDQLKKMPAQQNVNASQTNVPLMAGAAGSAGPASPITPTYPQHGYGANSMKSEPYTAPGQGGYTRGQSPYVQPHDQYGMTGAAAVPAAGPGRRSPGQSPYDNRGYGQQASMDPYGRTSPRAQDPYAQQQPTNPLDMGFQRSTSPQGYDNGYDNAGYGRQNPAMIGGLGPVGGAGGRPGPSPQMRSPGPLQQAQGNGYDQRSYSPSNGGSGYGTQHQQQQGYGAGYGGVGQQPQRSYTGDSSRPLAPQRQYTGSSSPGPQAQGGGGFDFTGGGFSRPTPLQRSETGESYPGRKAYQPSGQQGW